MQSSDAQWMGFMSESAEPEVVVYDQFDVALEDVDLLGEVELLTTFIIAASKSEGRLSMDKIDELFESQARRQ